MKCNSVQGRPAIGFGVGGARAMTAVCLLLAGSIATAAPVVAQTIEPDLGSCRFGLPKDVTTIVYDSYGGGLDGRYRSVEGGASFGRILFKVPKRDTAVFVVLYTGGGEWEMLVEPGAELAGVLVLSDSDQVVVTNVPAQTQVGFSIHQDIDGNKGGQGSGCPTGIRYDQMRSDQPTTLRRFMDFEFSRRVHEHHRSNVHAFGSYVWPECEFVTCEGRRPPSLAGAAMPGFWSRLFASGPKVPAHTVQTATRIQTR
jgi:hypothetical protein